MCNFLGRRTEHNPFTNKEKSWDPYGVTRLDMSDLLLGERIIELSLPIRSCKTPDVIDGRGSGNYSDKIVGKPGSVDGPGMKIFMITQHKKLFYVPIRLPLICYW